MSGINLTLLQFQILAIITNKMKSTPAGECCYNEFVGWCILDIRFRITMPLVCPTRMSEDNKNKSTSQAQG